MKYWSSAPVVDYFVLKGKYNIVTQIVVGAKVVDYFVLKGKYNNGILDVTPESVVDYFVLKVNTTANSL